VRHTTWRRGRRTRRPDGPRDQAHPERCRSSAARHRCPATRSSGRAAGLQFAWVRAQRDQSCPVLACREVPDAADSAARCPAGWATSAQRASTSASGCV